MHKVKQQVKEEKEKEKKIYAKMFAWRKPPRSHKHTTYLIMLTYIALSLERSQIEAVIGKDHLYCVSL